MAIGKKKFFEVSLPLIEHSTKLIAAEEEELIGKTIKVDLTRKLRGKSLEITFKIDKKGKAVPKRLNLLGYYIRRMMRKSADYVEDSFSTPTKNASLRVKPFLITRNKVSRRVRKALRNKAKEEIAKALKDEDYENIFLEVISNKFQKSLSLKLKKIYPLSLCEIRDIFVEKREIEAKETEEKIPKRKPVEELKEIKKEEKK